MGFHSQTLLACILVLGCSRSELQMQPAELSAGGSAAPDPSQGGKAPNDDPSDAPRRPTDTPSATAPDEPTPTKGALPEICVALHVDSGDRVPDGRAHSLVLVAPLAAERGPFELTRDESGGSAFSTHGRRFAFVDDSGLFVVDSWPPRPTALETAPGPRDVAWADDARLVVTTGTSLELHDIERRTHETLRKVTETPGSADIGQFYLARPSPDGRWLAFAEHSSGVHDVWLMRLDGSHEARLIDQLSPGSVIAWFDWAPNSEHLAFSVAGPNGPGPRPYSVSTKNGSIGAVAPISFALGDNESVPTFDFSPDGKALHYFYERLEPTTNEVDFRLYLVDMSGEVPGESVLLSSFGERYWSSPGLWSPNSERVAFHAEFVGNGVTRARELISKANRGSTAPVEAHVGEFDQVLKQQWSPDATGLYFTAMNADQVERVYRSDRGKAVLLSKNADTRGLFVSSVPGCIAYSQFLPTPAITIVKESSASSFEVGQPEWNAPDWTGSFDSSFAIWVDDSSGLRGLLYLTSSLAIGDTLAWVSVAGCVPQNPQVLIAGHDHQSLGVLDISTIDEWPFQK